MKKSMVLAVLFLALGLGLAQWLMKRPDSGPMFAASDTLPETDAGGNTAPITVQQGKNIDQLALARKALVEQLRRQYGTQLKNPYWQLKMIEYVTDILKKQYPNDWKQHLEAILREAFPELADALIKKAGALDEYLTWIDQVQTSGTFQNEEERRKALWDKRVALFGQEAYVIWEAAYKDDQFSAGMKTLAQNNGSFEDKVGQYTQLMEKVFGNDVLDSPGAHKTQIMTKFLELENVQSDLHGMAEEQRQQALIKYYDALKLDDGAKSRLMELYSQRNDEWSAGRRYQQKLEELTGSLKGADLDRAKHDLQDEIFGKEQAQFIRNEEATGYCRYCQKQQFGIN